MGGLWCSTVAATSRAAAAGVAPPSATGLKAAVRAAVAQAPRLLHFVASTTDLLAARMALLGLPVPPAFVLGTASPSALDMANAYATFAAEGIADPLRLARQILLLLDGSFAVVLLHRDPSYMETAGEAAHRLIEAALHPLMPQENAREAAG